MAITSSSSSRSSAAPVAAVAVITPSGQRQTWNGHLVTRLLSLPLLASASSSSPIHSYYGEAAAPSATAFVSIPPTSAVLLRRRSTVGSAPTVDSNVAWTLRSSQSRCTSFGAARVSTTVHHCYSGVETARVSMAAHRSCNRFAPGRASTGYYELTATSATIGDDGGGGGGGGGGDIATEFHGLGGSASGISSTKSHNENIPETKRSTLPSDPAATAKGGDSVVAPVLKKVKREESGALKRRTWGPAGGGLGPIRTVRRRMLTKKDWRHVHAASSLLYQVCGSLWLLNVLGTELFAGIPQLETDTPFPLLIIGTGLVSVLSSIPMLNTRSWVLNGACASVIQLWYAWYVSGAYPASLAPADPWLAAASFAILVITYVEAEESIAKENRARKKELEIGKSAGVGRGRLSPKPASGHIEMRRGDHGWGDAINRGGSIANLFPSLPHLYATLTGSGWVERLGEAYPAAPALLFHAYFAVATSGSITLLAATLYTRRLIDARVFGMIQLLSFTPLVTSFIDVRAMGSATTGNPLEIYFGFLH